MTTLAKPDRKHRLQAQWVDAQARMRASYLATRRLLSPFLVPHRFEGTTPPQDLRRAGYGYGIALNKSYLQEIIGHVRSAGATYEWGALADGEPDSDGLPSGGLAREIATQATRDGMTLENFIEGEVLEWMLSSPGGFIVVDAPANKGELTKADEKETGKRPYFHFIPWGQVEDVGIGDTGFRWVKFTEKVDNRKPDGEDEGEDEHHILYELTDSGDTQVTRFDKDGKVVKRTGEPGEPVPLGKIVDTHGVPYLPLIPVKFGTHPEIAFIGTGLLLGLDDIVIDLFNVTSEMREGYRDACFAPLVHLGPEGDKVQEQLKNGSRLVMLGDNDGAQLDRLAADSSEVANGMELLSLGVRNWALSAKRQAAEAMQNASAQQSSGVALSAEFQLDLKPLLVSICETLDAIETEALFVAAQMAGETPDAADEISVKRGTEFRLEDEASRIARIVKEYALSLPLTAEMKVQLALAWLRAADVIDLSEEVEVAETPEAAPTGQPGADADAVDGDAEPPVQGEQDGETPPTPPVPGVPAAPERPVVQKMTVGERIEQELRELAESQQTKTVNMNSAPPGGFFPPLQLEDGGAAGIP